MNWNVCRLCSDNSDVHRPIVRYSIRHYCHPECGFARWGDAFLKKIPAYEIGNIPYRLIRDNPERKKLALELAPDNLRETLAAL